MISLSTFYFLLSTFVLGAVIGSFLNVVILRHEKSEGLNGRSHCPTCKKTLRWHELIPILSYLAQRGKCRSCKAHISVQYPIVELATGIVFVYVVTTHYSLLTTHSPLSVPFLLSTFYILLLLATWSTLIVIFVYDLKTKLIPDRFSYTFAALALAASLVGSYDAWSSPFYFLLSTFYPGILLFLPFFALWYFSRGRWIGLGDGKLALGIGFLLGIFPGLSAIMFAFWTGALVSLALIGLQRLVQMPAGRPAYSLLATRYSILSPPTHYPLVHPPDALPRAAQPLTLKSEVPFGPFLVLGTALVYFLHWTALPPF